MLLGKDGRNTGNTRASKMIRERRRQLQSGGTEGFFDPSCSTLKVYEEGAKNVALSRSYRINATIFAYGQTSSGKTYTMRGITENAVTDIFEHIKN
ncbi:hypothetical protein OIU78_016900, partial [Salix suchowensis]